MKDKLNGATGFKLRMIFGRWWFKLFKPLPGVDLWEVVGEHGPMEWSEVAGEQAKLIELGLFDIERELGSRGK